MRRNNIAGFHFRRQQIIDGFIVDFYCHTAGLVIEIDGAIHEKQGEYDEERDKAISRRQLRVIRFSNDDVRTRIEWVIDEIRKACLESCGGLPQDGKSLNPSPNPSPKRGGE